MPEKRHSGGPRGAGECPQCSGGSRVLQVRAVGRATKRRLECTNDKCLHRWTTRERIEDGRHTTGSISQRQ